MGILRNQVLSIEIKRTKDSALKDLDFKKLEKIEKKSVEVSGSFKTIE